MNGSGSFVVLSVVGLTVSCGGPSDTVVSRMQPTAPTENHPRTLPITPTQMHGTVSLLSVAATGTPVRTRWCETSGKIVTILFVCTDELQVNAEVSVDQDVAVMNVQVDLWDGKRLCATGISKNSAASKGIPLQLQVPLVMLSSGEGTFCGLPVTTTRITLDAGLGEIPEYERSYTFELPPR
jgi:hypothetical protein